MKKFLLFTLILILSFGVIGCARDSIQITSGTLTREDNKTLANVNISITSTIWGMFELYPAIDSTLLDNLGNKYHALDMTPESNISGKISKTGEYSGTLIFPKLDNKANYLRLRIDNVRYYYGEYGKLYVLTFNFREGSIIDKTTKKNIARNTNISNSIRTKHKIYTLESVTVSTENGDIIKTLKPNR